MIQSFVSKFDTQQPILYFQNIWKSERLSDTKQAGPLRTLKQTTLIISEPLGPDIDSAFLLAEFETLTDGCYKLRTVVQNPQEVLLSVHRPPVEWAAGERR